MAKRILVADDNAANQQLVVTRVRHMGYEAAAVSDGHAVLAALEAGPWDIILMDCQMPGLDGFETTRAIRAREAAGHTHIPIIALTANNTAEDKAVCLQHGMDDYLTKPIKGPVLEAMLKRYLK